MTLIALSIGSNLGKREENINKAIKMLSERGVIVQEVSSFYETEPWGYKDQPAFINIAVKAKTSLSPQKLLDVVKSIELKLGREKNFKWGPRLIDIDIIFYNDLIIDNDEIKIPHPLMQEREFVLKPLVEIMPHMVHPLFQRNIETLLNEFKGGIEIGKNNKHQD
ncbi:MAG TPA: 2-amino-4-hydroxy-6-hydroxymethyldihydropteridine diphosphokinase [Nitrospirae bacterium]|nr:2-amino-4-hydroxy-6-hydroxymethyldihydropteridine diphosphokinase [Nitrospirota bacterium]